MFGMQAFLATSLGSLLTYVMISAALLGIAYFCYSRLRQQHAQNQNAEFAPIRQEREQRDIQVQEHVADSLSIQENANQILTGIQQQQTHLGLLIQDFDLVLGNVQAIDADLEQTNHSLQERIITPISQLLQKMQTQFQAMSEQLSRLSNAFTESNQAIVARERDLAQIVHTFAEIEANAQVGMSQLNSIATIRKSLHRKTQKIKELEKTLAELTENHVALVEIADKQEKMIDGMLGSPERERRSSLPSSYKYSPNLFEGRRRKSGTGTGTPLTSYMDNTQGMV